MQGKLRRPYLSTKSQGTWWPVNWNPICQYGGNTSGLLTLCFFVMGAWYLYWHFLGEIRTPGGIFLALVAKCILIEHWKNTEIIFSYLNMQILSAACCENQNSWAQAAAPFRNRILKRVWRASGGCEQGWVGIFDGPSMENNLHQIMTHQWHNTYNAI